MMQGDFWPDTLEEARAQVQEALASGQMIDCPCCGQTCKQYARRIYRTVALCLWMISRAGVDGIEPRLIFARMSARGFPMSGNDHSKLALWSLAHRNPETGRWHCTPLGHDFLAGNARIPKFAEVFNGEVKRYSDETVDIREIAREFDLAEILDPDNLWR